MTDADRWLEAERDAGRARRLSGPNPVRNLYVRRELLASLLAGSDGHTRARVADELGPHTVDALLGEEGVASRFSTDAKSRLTSDAARARRLLTGTQRSVSVPVSTLCVLLNSVDDTRFADVERELGPHTVTALRQSPT